MIGTSLAVALAFALPAAAPPAPTPSAHAARKECKPKPTLRRVPRRVWNTNVSCREARRVATRVVAPPPRGCVKITDAAGHVRWYAPCRKLGYRCTGRAVIDNNVIDATCRDGRKVVRFQF